MAATAITFALTGCAFESDASSLDDVASRTRAAGTARVTITVAIPRYRRLQLLGSVDFGRSRARLRSQRYRVETLVDGTRTYARYSGTSAWIDGGDHYLRRWLRWGDPLAWLEGVEGAEAVDELGASHLRARIDGFDTDVRTDRKGRASRVRYIDASNAQVTIEYTEFGAEVPIAGPAPESILTVAEYQRRHRRQAQRLLRLSEPE